jgi:hypothetical protein
MMEYPLENGTLPPDGKEQMKKFKIMHPQKFSLPFSKG